MKDLEDPGGGKKGKWSSEHWAPPTYMGPASDACVRQIYAMRCAAASFKPRLGF